MNVCMPACMHSCMHARMHVCVYSCMYAYTHVICCMSVYMYSYVCVYEQGTLGTSGVPFGDYIKKKEKRRHHAYTTLRLRSPLSDAIASGSARAPVVPVAEPSGGLRRHSGTLVALNPEPLFWAVAAQTGNMEVYKGPKPLCPKFKP